VTKGGFSQDMPKMSANIQTCTSQKGRLFGFRVSELWVNGF